MTSEVDSLKTNEFLRRRKLRLQQVREQSKDIAKKIRQRAKVENLRQVIELDSKKRLEYLQRQEKLVKKLEEYYAEGIKNVGVSHRNASEVQLQDGHGDKVDLSKQRGKEAAAELRKKRQEILDKHKKLLDRRLQAREVANEISRDKSAAVVNKLQSKPVIQGIEETQTRSSVAVSDKDGYTIQNDEKDRDVTRNDMATQWDLEEVPNEWEPNIPTLALPKDDNSVKESNNNIVDSKSDKSKRHDLFALSEEMPSSLRSGHTNQEERVPVKSSLTLVSEYLQNRGLRLRETDITRSNKKMEDLQSLKQTILHTRASKEGTRNVCHVHDEELVPVPSWQAEHTNCGCCPCRVLHKSYENCLTTANIMQLNKNFNALRPKSAHIDLPNTSYSSIKSVHSNIPNKKNCSIRPTHPDLLPTPVLRGTSPFRRTRVSPGSFSAKKSIDRPFKSSMESTIPKKSSVTIYNHSTKGSRDIPYNEKVVVRDMQDDDDAYSQAMKESTTSNNEDKDHHKKIQDIRSKVAMTKQNVEKEYRDTISFLNALPKDKGNKPIKTAYMDEHRQQMLKETRQKNLQQEYRKIEKECKKQNCRNKVQRNSRSPAKENGDIFETTDFQYSWMPVPESDENLAIHTIPTTLKEGKSGNTVKFSKVDSYHEYRSRHKHTPPTKDTAQEKPRHVEAVVIPHSSDTDSVSSDSSTENIELQKNDENVDNREKLSDAERIIIYKILDSKTDKKKKTSKPMKDLAKSRDLLKVRRLIEQKANCEKNNNDMSPESHDKYANSNTENILSFEQLDEGVYEAVNENGDNITSMYFCDRRGEGTKKALDELKYGRSCTSRKRLSSDQQKKIGCTSKQCHSGDKRRSPSPRLRSSCPTECNCAYKRVAPKEKIEPVLQPSTATSTSSFKTANNDKTNNFLSDEGFIKLIDSGGQEAGKFFIGASGLLKNDAYEVVIQLRKKGDGKEISSENPEEIKKQEDALSIDKVASATQTSLREIHESSRNKTEAEGSTATELPQEIVNGTESIPDADANVVTDVPSNSNLKQTTPRRDDSPRSTEIVSNNEFNEPQVYEKGVSVEIQDTNSQNIPNSYPTPRPATSTYTQTSMSSPNHRPVFFHMSSSTSTAYMSPPELILPKLLSQCHQLANEDIYDPEHHATEEYELSNQRESEDYDCRCRKCMHARKPALIKHVHAHQYRKEIYQKPRTPPNTVRSGHITDTEHIFINREHKKVAAPQPSNKKSKHMCRKCGSQNRIHESNNSLCHKKSRHSTDVKHSSRNIIMRATSSAASSNRASQATSKTSKTNMKPFIKKYIDKLLVLNKETLKAVQIIDQDCSSVTTPGSSIIDVPSNIDQRKPILENKLSLQQIQTILKQKVFEYNENKYHKINDDEVNGPNSPMCSKIQFSKNVNLPKLPRKRAIHKVKSLNISKNVSRVKKTCETKKPHTIKEVGVKMQIPVIPSRSKVRSRSSPTPRLARNSDTTDRSANSDVTHTKRNHRAFTSKLTEYKSKTSNTNERQSESRQISESSNRAMTSISSGSDRNPSLLKRENVEIPMSISTQTSINVDTEINFMELAEDKLQNIEKIADLTEKCTKRLSNLAKVLEEVRKNKTLVYSKNFSTSDTTSDSDQKSDKNVKKITAPLESFNNTSKRSDSKSPELNMIDTLKEIDNNSNSTDFVPFLSNIPKPRAFKGLNSDLDHETGSSSPKKSNSPSPIHESVDQHNKQRAKPPPALSRIHLKHVQDFVVPHELSTVVEVDSPMSVKLKSSRNDTKIDAPDTFNRNNGVSKDGCTTPPSELKMTDSKSPDLLDSNAEISNKPHKMPATGFSDNSKIQMIDIRQFNEIMLKPFFSIQEYAKQCNVGALDDGSNLDDIVKDDQLNDELSSLHSEASLPDVISELLKRNIISEPFKFDTGSNANSTTVSSESTISVLALSRAKHGKKKNGVLFQNKENAGETSDTLSISSNPDLEHAFKKLGLGWASSTLKKTKERLALSSSSNTSSSSLTQFKVKSFNQEIPVILTDTVSSHLNLKPLQRTAVDNVKSVEQQTSLMNSMTVKEFLTKELAKKITFNNKSRNDTEEEFVTLFETKMPEEMKHSSLMVREENYSINNSMRSGNNNRARTSTPVQLFKSMTYHSSSSSNMSNGLFSNADDLSSVKVTSNSMKHSTSDKDDLIIPNFSLRMKRGSSECSKSD